MLYDIIADVHGYHETLCGLLEKLDYTLHEDGWKHPQRKVVFLGDFIDRGPRQAETYRTVRKMIDGGHALAVMGNHEFNAIGWTIRDPVNPAEFLRSHTSERRKQHEAFLEQIGEDSAFHAEIIAWFWQLPLWLELDGLRIVHAAWDEAKIKELIPLLMPGNKLSAGALQCYNDRNSATYDALETILKGMEVTLPESASFEDKDGKQRNEIRLKWWETGPSSYRNAALMSDDIVNRLSLDTMLDDPRPGYADHRPVFIGHHALSGLPRILSSKVACLDFSVINQDGWLCAYRWSGETELVAQNLVWVPVTG